MMKYSLSPREILRAKPDGFPEIFSQTAPATPHWCLRHFGNVANNVNRLLTKIKYGY